ncbi:hypothetical protein G6F32_015626 [Rhizopus arrhizus]|nr:hypothetical protein G6F32_015626 [Rhizopus arrhizus]
MAAAHLQHHRPPPRHRLRAVPPARPAPADRHPRLRRRPAAGRALRWRTAVPGLLLRCRCAAAPRTHRTCRCQRHATRPRRA